MQPRRTDQFCLDRVNPYPFYSPRFWAGMRISDYMGLMARNRFRIHPTRIPMAFLVGGCSAASSVLSLGQSLFLNRKIEAFELTEPPIFVIGHWRSGTTLLHELLCLDRQFAFPSTFECFVPTHHGFTKPLLRPLIGMLMPGKRPMDAMPAGPDLPQEDEFALMGMGVPTPYYRIAFCNEPPRFLEMLNLKNASQASIEQLRESLNWFYKSITWKNQKRLVLKSPTHTGRIGHLAKWFPNAKFVHITRHPYKVFPSTVHLWKSLASVQGYQLPRNDDAKSIDYVNRCYREMYDGYFEQVKQIPQENIFQVRFNDLIQDPIRQIESIYSAFDLNGFGQVEQRLREFWDQRKSHQTNKTQLNDQTRIRIDQVWSDYIEHFGYGATKPDPAFGKIGLAS